MKGQKVKEFDKWNETKKGLMAWRKMLTPKTTLNVLKEVSRVPLLKKAEVGAIKAK